MNIGWTALKLHSLSKKVHEAIGTRAKPFSPPLFLGV